MTTRAASRTSPWPARGRRLLRAVACGVGFAVPVSLLALVVREKFTPVLDLDAAIIRAATDVTRSHPTFRSALIAWQQAFQPIPVYVVASGVCLWMWLRRRYTSRAWWAWVTMMITWNLALQLKLLVERARPSVENPVSTAPGWSFPSGHAANTAGAVTVVSILLWPVLGRVARRILLVVAPSLVVLTALDRVFLGVHYPSDVTAGILVGCGIAVASYAGYRGWNPTDPHAAAPAPDRLERATAAEMTHHPQEN